MVLLHIKSPATESNLYLQRIGCKYDLRTTFLNCYLSGFFAGYLSLPRSPSGCTARRSIMGKLADRIEAPRVPVAATSPASCFALFTADSVIILIGALLSCHIVVLSEPFPLRLCFLAGLFLPY